MSDEPTGEPTPTSAPTEPTQTQPTPPPPPKFEGKTPDELMSILQDRDKTIGRQGTSLSQHEYEITRLRDEVNRLYAERSQPRPTERGTPKYNVDYEDLGGSMAQIAEAKAQEQIARAMEMFQQSRLTDVAQRTTIAFVDGQRNMKQNPGLYAGIEEQVKQGIAQVYGPLASQGQDVSNYLRDPEVWETAAVAIRYKRGELDKIKPAVTKGMDSQPADLPSQTRQTQDDDGIIIEDKDRKEYEDEYGKKGTDKEIRELLKLGLDTQKRR